MYKEELGIVVMLDALGAKNFSMDESKKFLESRNQIVAELNKEKANILKVIKEIGDISKIEKLKTFPEPDIFTFGDTIILNWGLLPDFPVGAMLIFMHMWLQPIIRISLEKQVLLRGAISIGEYIKDEKAIIGPAIGDAASWYEKAQWVGVIATPRCGLYINEMKEKFDATRNDSLFISYSVPFKNSTSREMWVLSWPLKYSKDENNHEYDLSLFFEHLTKFQVPYGKEEKIYNTIAFFKWFIINAKLTKSDFREVKGPK